MLLVAQVKVDGLPLAVSCTVEPVTPSAKVPFAMVAAVVISAGAFTVSVKDWVGAVPTPLVAVNVRLKTPPRLPDGVPLSTPLVNVTPPGRVPPVRLKVGTGKPLAFKVKLPALPTVKVVLATLVNTAGSPTVRVKVWVATAPTPLSALTEIV